MIRNQTDQAAALEMEVMLSKVEAQDMARELKKIIQGSSESDKIFKEKIQKFLSEGNAASNPEVEEARKSQINEQVDSKI